MALCPSKASGRSILRVVDLCTATLTQKPLRTTFTFAAVDYLERHFDGTRCF